MRPKGNDACDDEEIEDHTEGVRWDRHGLQDALKEGRVADDIQQHDTEVLVAQEASQAEAN